MSGGGINTPNPGSDEAREQGCTCPWMDNHRGDPELGRIRGFWINEGCPIHSPQKLEAEGETK